MDRPRPAISALLALVLAACTGAASGTGEAPGQDSQSPDDANDVSRPESGAIPVRLERTEAGWTLLRGGEPYFIRGGGGSGHLDALVAAGGNSLRTWGVSDETSALLDAAHERGLTVTVGLWLGHPEHGFDYADEDAVAEQREQIRRAVMTLRDHPAVLMWGVGNEVEIAVNEPFVWEAINDIARMIHAIDLNHPTLAVTADLGAANEVQLAELAPEIDIWGINSYAAVVSLPERLDERGFDGPYVVTEFAHFGTWESATTDWGSPFEPATAARAEAYRRAWNGTVSADTARCLGAYAFLWRSAEHPVDTWYPLFTHEGRPLAPVDTLTQVWTGQWPSDRAPVVRALTGDARGAVLTPGARLSATLDAEDPEGEPLSVTWLLAPDAEVPAWDVPRRCDAIAGASGLSITVDAPSRPGAWRLLAFAADPGGRTGYASLPFFVEGSPDSPAGGVQLPFSVDDHYAPSGWMGHFSGMTREDCEHPDGLCGGPCHRFTVEPGGEGWAGVVWQHPVNNWGEQPGLAIPAGAREVHWRAWADRDDVEVNFFAGLRDADGFSRETGSRPLPTEPTDYSLSLEGVDYSDVAGAFGWATSVTSTASFTITDIEWVD